MRTRWQSPRQLRSARSNWPRRKLGKSRNGIDHPRRAKMGVKVREKQKNSGAWWVFINYKGKRTSRQIGTKRAADKVKEQIEARLKLGQDALPKEKQLSPTVNEYYENVFVPVYLESAVAQSTAASYGRNFSTH